MAALVIREKRLGRTKLFWEFFYAFSLAYHWSCSHYLKKTETKTNIWKVHMNKKKHELYVKYTPTHSALLNPRQGEDFIKASEHVQKRKRDRKTTNSKINKLSWGTTNKILKSPLQEPIIVFWSPSLFICWAYWLILWDFMKSFGTKQFKVVWYNKTHIFNSVLIHR